METTSSKVFSHLETFEWYSCHWATSKDIRSRILNRKVDYETRQRFKSEKTFAESALEAKKGDVGLK